ncbi:glycerate kinase [Aquiflexum balticum DSM 16537]|uniref:Glycerate kinase n=1 Tax=Aquiflexum balticum DSM 16537 TaxID=758820 RepID=A0A1W2H9N8_9BACT|nr:glycerate kinase [Aquiflexum balticum]SMD45605.1 glycerate kinase [Aquiflexum balticum DSM 16537]
MKILIAPNAFKGTIEADEAAAIISSVISSKRGDVETILCPIADGGDGTCYLLGKALNMHQHHHFALDPLGRPIEGFFFMDKVNAIAYLDVSTVSGIKSLKLHERDVWIASTYGTGELIQKAIHSGAKHIVLGLGGSASIDLGLGILRGLGFLFLDENGREITLFSNVFLKKIRYIQSPVPKPVVSFTCLCDVNNYFYGTEGAIPVFGPQKGLKEEDMEDYENACSGVLELLSVKTGKSMVDQPSFGAAGGIAFGLSFFFPVEIQMGAQWFFQQVKMEEKVVKADIIITGEGRYDSQSAGGKGSFELLQLAKKHHKKTVLFTSGSGGNGSGFDQVKVLPDLNFEQNDFQLQARKNLQECVEKWISSF